MPIFASEKREATTPEPRAAARSRGAWTAVDGEHNLKTGAMQSPPSELACCECGGSYDSAALLLQHFARHVSDSSTEAMHRSGAEKPKPKKRGRVPDLYPIDFKGRAGAKARAVEEKEENGDSGVEDLVNPLKYCLVTLDEGAKAAPGRRRYECGYCSRNFGWSTDLKRHILTHTGEKPFRCTSCECRFTRNFLLQKHVQKAHPDAPRPPPLASLAKPPRKQDKCNIKQRKTKA